MVVGLAASLPSLFGIAVGQAWAGVPPTARSAPSISGTAQIGHTLTASSGSWDVTGNSGVFDACNVGFSDLTTSP